jgi:hypothetical protein
MNPEFIFDLFNLVNRHAVVRVQTRNDDIENDLRPAQTLSRRKARVGRRLTF